MTISCTSPVGPSGPVASKVASSDAGIPDDAARARALQAAKAFCDERGLVMVPMNMDSRAGAYVRSLPDATVAFSARKPGDPQIQHYVIRVKNR